MDECDAVRTYVRVAVLTIIKDASRGPRPRRKTKAIPICNYIIRTISQYINVDITQFPSSISGQFIRSCVHERSSRARSRVCSCIKTKVGCPGTRYWYFGIISRSRNVDFMSLFKCTAG